MEQDVHSASALDLKEVLSSFGYGDLTGAIQDAAFGEVVRHEDDLYVRPVRGRQGWYRGTQTRHEGHVRSGGVDKDRAYILPILKLAKAKNPDLLFFASPWSPPGWMKSSQSLIGGQLRPESYGAYAQYFVRFNVAKVSSITKLFV